MKLTKLLKEFNLDCETLKEYIFNREEFFKSYTETGDYTKEHIKKVLTHFKGNKRQSAIAIGWTINTLNSKIERYKLTDLT